MNTQNKLKQLREIHNMTLESVGKKIGVGKSTVRKWEVGAIENMRRDKIEKLCKLYSVDANYLITDTDFAVCPLCGYTYDPLSDDKYHDVFHERFLKATNDFGKIDSIEVATNKTNTILRLIGFHSDAEKIAELYDKYLDYMFIIWLWENNFNYVYKNDFMYKWKQNYVSENLYPSDLFTTDVCNYIRNQFFVSEIEEYEQDLRTLQDKAYRFDKLCENEEFYNYIMRLSVLPDESKQAIYAQIRFQENEVNTKQNDPKRGTKMFVTAK